MSHNPRVKDSRDDQIITLLNQLGERLIRSEKERIALKGSLQRYDELYNDLESRAANSERAYLSMQSKVSRTTDLEDDFRKWMARIEEEQKYQAEKLAKAEAITAKIEEAMAHQNRMNRRLEKVIKDKARLAQKVERIEDTVIETREALNAKAMVLLTDENLAGKAALPAETEKKTRASTSDKPLFLRAAGIAAVVVLAVASAWAISQMPDYKQEQALDAISPAAGGEVLANVNSKDPAGVLQTDDAILQEQFEANPDALASALNQIEPGVGSMPENLQQIADTNETIKAEPTVKVEPVAFTPAPAPIEEFNTGKFITKEQSSQSLAERITPDAGLPPIIKEVEAKAFEGIAEAQHDLAAIYTAGHAGVQVSYEKAAMWFKEAALQGIANARYNLGVLFHQGLGVNKDINQAVNWYRAAAELGHPEAQYNLGIAYVEGIGASYTPQLAARYFQEAAIAGIVEAAYNLGLIHENALLGTQDLKKALFWYKHAANQGSPEAQTALKQLAVAMELDSVAIEKLYQHISKETLPEKTGEKDIKASQGTVTPKPDNRQPVALASATPVISEAALPKENKQIVLTAQVQEQLMRNGLYPGPANGSLNPVTEDAIRSYQAKHGLARDGRASQALLVHMMARDIPDMNGAKASPDPKGAMDRTERTAEIVPGSLTQDDLAVPAE